MYGLKRRHLSNTEVYWCGYKANSLLVTFKSLFKLNESVYTEQLMCLLDYVKS